MQRVESPPLGLPVWTRGLPKRLARLRRRLAEHREIRRWLRTNPPETGRATGCRV